MPSISAPLAMSAIKETSQKDTADSFVQGQFDLYATQKIDPKTRVFVEMVFEAGPDNGYGLDLERLNITRQLTPGLSVAWGRFHTPIGYWNTAYHHGALIQDTVFRPTFLDFEDGNGAIFPTHIIGIMADGKVSTGGGDLNYMLAVGNGSSINTDGCAASSASCPVKSMSIMSRIPKTRKWSSVQSTIKCPESPWSSVCLLCMIPSRNPVVV